MNPLRLVRSRPRSEVEPLADGAILHTYRDGFHEELRLGPNIWHVRVIHEDGTTDEDGYGQNLLTNGGRDLWDETFGQRPAKEGTATPISATALTPGGGGMTTDQYKGWRVYCPVTGITTPPVYGNVGSNSATVLTIDQWWNAADGTGTTPASGNAYFLIPDCKPRFMGITENAAAAAATDTTLTGEITTGGCNRQVTTFAHTAGTSTYTSIKSFAVTGTFPAVQKGGLFTAANTTAAGILVFEATFTSASVINGDTLQVTATVTTTG